MNKEELLEKYIQNKLSPQEKLSFDKLVAEDTAFKAEVNWHTNLKRVTEHNDDADFRALVSEFEPQNKSEIVLKKKNYTKWIAAASILLLLGVGYFLTTNITADSNELFADYFEPYRNVVHPIVRGENYDDLKTKAFIAYETKNYKVALNSFNVLLSESNDATVLFYKANVLLQLNKTDEAISILSENKNLPEKLKAQQQWYLALAYIKTNANEKAKTILKELIDNGNYKKEKAEQLLKELTP